MNYSTFEKIKKTYGRVSSWALWRAGKTISDTSNISLFINPSKDTLQTLHVNYIFVGLNISGPISQDKPFGNFHGGRNDYWLRDAIRDTQLVGSYMTDILKFHVDPNSNSVVKYFRENKADLNKHVIKFRQELEDIGANKCSTLIALGNDTFSILNSASLENPILKLKHYAYRQKRGENKALTYRNEVKELLNS